MPKKVEINFDKSINITYQFRWEVKILNLVYKKSKIINRFNGAN